MSKAVEQADDSCNICASLKRFPKSLIQQSSDDPPDLVGISYAADILKRNRQLILIVRETMTSYSSACFIQDEKRETLRDGLIRVLVHLKPLNGPSVVVRVDPAPGFRSLQDDPFLKQFNISVEVGRVKNSNKNPVAEKAITEFEDELFREEHGESPISILTLAVATARLNSRLRQKGLSSRELWTQRNQFTQEQLPISDMNVIRAQQESRNINHGFCEISKCRKPPRTVQDISVGELVYLYTDKSKIQSRSWYLVASVDGEWCLIKRFSGRHLRASFYKVKLTECYTIPVSAAPHQNKANTSNDDNEPDMHDQYTTKNYPKQIVDPRPDHPEVPHILICENLDDLENAEGPPPQIYTTKTNMDGEQNFQRALRKRSELKAPIRFKDYDIFSIVLTRRRFGTYFCYCILCTCYPYFNTVVLLFSFHTKGYGVM